jgi:hypothetical protein
MQNRRTIHQLISGDVEITNFSYDVQSLANKFSRHLQCPQVKFDFTVDLINVKGEAWKTVLVEPIEAGTLGHFEIIYTQQFSHLLLGVTEEKENFNFKDHIGGGQGKGMYISNMSLYETQKGIHDRAEFKSVVLNIGDKIGLFFDMQEHCNGRMFLTHNGRICGQMYKGLEAPVRPGFSFNCNLVKGVLQVTTTNNSTLPVGWNDNKFRV